MQTIFKALLAPLVVFSMAHCSFAENAEVPAKEERVQAGQPKPRLEEAQSNDSTVDRSERTRAYPNPPSYPPRAPGYVVETNSEPSRYRTDQGWSRGQAGVYGHRHGSDLPPTDYNRGDSEDNE